MQPRAARCPDLARGGRPSPPQRAQALRPRGRAAAAVRGLRRPPPLPAWAPRFLAPGPGRRRGANPPLPVVLAGSHDPLLEWAVRSSGSGLALLTEGSSDGLRRLAAGEAM